MANCKCSEWADCRDNDIAGLRARFSSDSIRAARAALGFVYMPKGTANRQISLATRVTSVDDDAQEED